MRSRIRICEPTFVESGHPSLLLRQIALDCDLTEELKCVKPCFPFLKKKVAIVIPLKESRAFSFFKGPLLKDPKHIHKRIGERTQAARSIKFTLLPEIAALRSTLKDNLYEAIELGASGKRIELKKSSEYSIPEELQRRLDDNAVLRSAFATLTPERRKSYIFHGSSVLRELERISRSRRTAQLRGWLKRREELSFYDPQATNATSSTFGRFRDQLKF